MVSSPGNSDMNVPNQRYGATNKAQRSVRHSAGITMPLTSYIATYTKKGKKKKKKAFADPKIRGLK